MKFVHIMTRCVLPSWVQKLFELYYMTIILKLNYNWTPKRMVSRLTINSTPLV